MAFQPALWLASILLAAWSCVVAAEESDIKSIALRTHSLQMVRRVPGRDKHTTANTAFAALPG